MKDITPEKYRCGSVVTGCPAIMKNGKNYVIIGKVVTASDYPELAGRIGEGESAIEIPCDMVDIAVFTIR